MPSGDAFISLVREISRLGRSYTLSGFSLCPLPPGYLEWNNSSAGERLELCCDILRHCEQESLMPACTAGGILSHSCSCLYGGGGVGLLSGDEDGGIKEPAFTVAPY